MSRPDFGSGLFSVTRMRKRSLLFASRRCIRTSVALSCQFLLGAPLTLSPAASSRPLAWSAWPSIRRLHEGSERSLGEEDALNQGRSNHARLSCQQLPSWEGSLANQQPAPLLASHDHENSSNPKTTLVLDGRAVRIRPRPRSGGARSASQNLMYPSFRG